MIMVWHETPSHFVNVNEFCSRQKFTQLNVGHRTSSNRTYELHKYEMLEIAYLSQPIRMPNCKVICYNRCSEHRTEERRRIQFISICKIFDMILHNVNAVL